MRGLTCEKAAERRARGLCPRHDVPAKRGGVLCTACTAKAKGRHRTMAERYRVSNTTLAEMQRALERAQ